MVQCARTAVRKQEAAAPPLVCLHGYASGAGIFYATLPPLTEAWPGPVYALDSPGCGLSERPAWRLGTAISVSEGEDWWIERLEAWRATMGIDKFVLCGHSLGGYMAVAYAERHPSRVDRLILVSPVGLPHPPAGLKERQAKASLFFRVVLGAWERGWGPFPIARWGPGLTLLNKYVGRRFADAAHVDKPALAEYLCANMRHGDESWGGVAHSLLLLPGAYPRSPLCDRIPRLEGGDAASGGVRCAPPSSTGRLYIGSLGPCLL